MVVMPRHHNESRSFLGQGHPIVLELLDLWQPVALPGVREPVIQLHCREPGLVGELVLAAIGRVRTVHVLVEPALQRHHSSLREFAPPSHDVVNLHRVDVILP